MFAAHAALLTGGGKPPPTVTNISPTYFYTARWQGFTIDGTNFVPGATTVSAAVAGGNVSATTVNAAGTSLTVSMYAVSAGSSAVSVTTPFGSASSQTITAAVEPPPAPPDTRPAPVLYGISPSSGTASQQRTVSGNNFQTYDAYRGTTPTYFLVNQFAYASVASVSNTSAVVTFPGIGAGTYTLSVYTGASGSGWVAGPTFTIT